MDRLNTTPRTASRKLGANPPQRALSIKAVATLRSFSCPSDLTAASWIGFGCEGVSNFSSIWPSFAKVECARNSMPATRKLVAFFVWVALVRAILKISSTFFFANGFPATTAVTFSFAFSAMPLRSATRSLVAHPKFGAKCLAITSLISFCVRLFAMMRPKAAKAWAMSARFVLRPFASSSSNSMD